MIITIGIPLHNNVATLTRAVHSILAQTHPHIRIHISDDASTDGSADIARGLAQAYPAITYTRQPANLNHHGNFRFLLQQAATPYFMWLAADDHLEPSYVERTLAVLEADPGVVACVSRVRFTRPDGGTALAAGTYALLHDAITNLAIYLSNPADNSRLFALHRTAVLQRCFPPDDFLVAYDWAAMAGTLLHGRHAEIPEVLLIREETPHAAYMAMIRRHAGSRLARLFPALRLTRDLLLRQQLPRRPPVLKALLFLNLWMHFRYAQAFHPRYARLEPFFRRHLLWRLETRG